MPSTAVSSDPPAPGRDKSADLLSSHRDCSPGRQRRGFELKDTARQDLKGEHSESDAVYGRSEFA